MSDSHDRYRQFGRVRARKHRSAIERAVGDVEGLIADHGIDRGEILAEAEGIAASVPARFRAELDGMAEALSVSADELRLYAFGGSALKSAITPGEAEPPGEGCTNVLVPAARTTVDGPLVLKNRDISGRGIRPQVLVEFPALGEANGFLSLTTAGSVFVFQGVNEAGLAVANTFVDEADESVDAEDRVRNGALIRGVLERSDTVEDAVQQVRDADVELAKGLTLFLADEADACILEVDPRGPRVERVEDGATPRTNHFPGEEPGESSGFRLARARDLVADLPERVSPADLFDLARDHRNGPGPNSICRHPTTGAGDPHTLSESTTVGTSVFVGGRPSLRSVPGNPCDGHPTTDELVGHSLDELEAEVEQFIDGEDDSSEA